MLNRIKTTKSLYLVMLAIMVLVILSACGSSDNSTSGSSAPSTVPGGTTAISGDVATAVDELPPPEKTDVTLRLNWRIKGEFAPFYITKEKGFFEKYGLNVEVLEGNGSGTTLQLIAQNRDDFGINSTVEPAQGIEKGMPVKIIATYMEKSPLLIASHPDTPVRTPKDLEGKKIVMSIASTLTNVFPQFLSSNNVDASKVQVVAVETSARNGIFLNKEVEAVAIFSTNEYPIFEKQLGTELVPLYLYDFGFDLAGMSIIANNSFLEKNPNTTRRFLAALNEGFAYTFENPRESAQIIKKLFPEEVDEDMVYAQIKLTGDISIIEGYPFGWMSEEKMIKTLDILETGKLIDKRIKLEDYYTNEFSPKP
jgi:ABC-type nitrate/sulfonate/bicarbonate transport system substrate-binding protein